MTVTLWLSLMVIGQQLLITGVFVARRRVQRHHWLGALLLLSAAAYLTQNIEPLRNGLLALRPLLIGLALATPYVLWQFGEAVFDLRKTPPAIVGTVIAIPAVAWLVFWQIETARDVVWQAAFIVNHIAGLAVVLFTLGSVMLGHGDDLLEPRRRYRVLFVALIGIQVSGILVVELFVDFDDTAEWLQLLNVTLIAALTLGLALPLLRIDDAAFSLTPAAAWEKALDRDSLDAAEQRLAGRLIDLMDGGYFRTPELSIGGLAKELEVPEHQLRRLINKHLGYQNFSAFLNYYRILDARAILTDPDRAGDKVLTVAMDLGYGSVGPFNRAFKQATGLTPSEYRQEHSGKS